MPNLKEVRNRISSVKSTQQITSAMKMVAASRLRKAQNAILQLRPYANKMYEILQDLSSSIEAEERGVFAENRGNEKVLVVTLASNRGLCGPFNQNIIKAFAKLEKETFAEQKANGNLEIFALGKKLGDFFSKRNYPLFKRQDDLLEHISFDKAAEVADLLMDLFKKGEYDRIELVYNRFKNAATQIVSVETFLPLQVPEASNGDKSKVDYIFEPGREEILLELIPKTLRIQLFKAMLDSVASEYGARMTAMHKATDNAEELLKELQLSYNKARQAAITNEILEIVSGANALKES